MWYPTAEATVKVWSMAAFTFTTPEGSIAPFGPADAVIGYDDDCGAMSAANRTASYPRTSPWFTLLPTVWPALLDTIRDAVGIVRSFVGEPHDHPLQIPGKRRHGRKRRLDESAAAVGGL